MLVSTDKSANSMYVSLVNMIINYDLPEKSFRLHY